MESRSVQAYLYLEEAGHCSSGKDLNIENRQKTIGEAAVQVPRPQFLISRSSK